MNLIVSDGPYVEGNHINVSCKVDWIKGDVTPKYLEVFLGSFRLGRSIMQDNIEYGEKFTFSKAVVLRTAPGNTNITCVHHFANESLERFLTITVIKGGHTEIDRIFLLWGTLTYTDSLMSMYL